MIAKLKFFLTHVISMKQQEPHAVARKRNLTGPVKLLFKPTLRAHKISPYGNDIGEKLISYLQPLISK